jgi:hypothetical protein
VQWAGGRQWPATALQQAGETERGGQERRQANSYGGRAGRQTSAEKRVRISPITPMFARNGTCTGMNRGFTFRAAQQLAMLGGLGIMILSYHPDRHLLQSVGSSWNTTRCHCWVEGRANSFDKDVTVVLPIGRAACALLVVGPTEPVIFNSGGF